MLMFFICLKLLSVVICYNCLLFVFDLFLCLLTVAISFYALLLCSGFVLLVLNIIHVLDLESVCFIPNIYTVILYTLDMFYEGHLESKERFAIKKYLLIIGKKKNMQVLSHTFTYFST